MLLAPDLANVEAASLAAAGFSAILDEGSAHTLPPSVEECERRASLVAVRARDRQKKAVVTIGAHLLRCSNGRNVHAAVTVPSRFLPPLATGQGDSNTGANVSLCLLYTSDAADE